MGKTWKNRDSQSCDICGESPAYYSKLAGKTLCKQHLTEVIMKWLLAGGVVVGLLYFTGIIQIF